ncbi:MULTISPECIES: glycosyltransferase [unclassified Candidatus Frackibacter]|uniref:glycosyltransferase n=1 Tax=unclassified Candidatus Frackibacter TaxID=2648818 RepID=UPI000792D1EA|nr:MULTISPECIES: glycosyltransferase [unclassified Candidatus Frackibacter]KXS41807.1 MAG: group 1 glycosyl transferase [Candidatus Frackibacter sp. T328-2]SDC55312.1 Glycosyltransferase involved in cell wall bisynthesis [Candidatus Frackibacter sp. WG11]SEM67370.1 Glycosyltransferase involved in cell wall bisynthesis [Candidatus Frackibacter sp. WG12]SFL78650.1 Glycosyltransferase involved in cell wall bisynthesis [Candidatus Frackibacter sp. WG13]
MKVLFQVRPDLLNVYAGDTIQILRTKEQVERLGIEVNLSTDLGVELDKYDLIHLFNTTRISETYQQMLNAKKQDKPVVLSTIYWDMEEYLRNERPDKLKWWQRTNEYRQEVMNLADILLPNSESEKRLIEKNFGIKDKFMVVPNGVSRYLPNKADDSFKVKYGLEDFILAVGRFDKRKNQLNVIKALKETYIPLVMIGSCNDPQYLRKCKAEANKETIFIDHLPQRKLASAYQAAKVHVLASWYDTPGLVSLEAGILGCNIVSTNRGSAKDYFKDLAWYCDPSDINSIYEAVLHAYYAELNSELEEYILTNFTWKITGEKTVEAYHRLLD